MLARRLKKPVPCDLTVVMGVNVDEAGSHDHASGIDNFGCVSLETSAALYCHDDTVGDGDIAHETVGSGAVDDCAIGDLEIEHGVPPSENSNVTTWSYGHSYGAL
ncbi:unannotated protein [freshwater metagenome]|uniref:Unannotated protein n=1 Tax=freshwater metagenome TaxID=449393 RepID=A0A6J7VJH4_9ZZZZ